MKIPSEKSINTYELTCLVEPEYTEKELTEAAAAIEELVTKNKGKVKETEQWGKKDLAYLIKKAGKQYREANFLHIIFEADPAHASQIKAAVNISESIIRYLLVKQAV